MMHTIEAIVDAFGQVRLLIRLLEEPVAVPGEAALLAEAALAADWCRPEEDAAWSHLEK